MKRLFPLLSVLVLLTAGSPSPPQPPVENPHPPIGSEDTARVAFAEKALKILMKRPTSSSKSVPGGVFLDKDESCVKAPSCYEKDLAFLNEVNELYLSYGELVEWRHAHVIPWSMEKFKGQGKAAMAPGSSLDESSETMRPSPQLKPDEYMVHVYAKFKNSDQWFHLNVIVTEGASGKISLRHFFALPMPSAPASMPPGVVC